jgi:hypothetical protein
VTGRWTSVPLRVTARRSSHRAYTVFMRAESGQVTNGVLPSAGASRVASGLLCLHAIAIIPAGPMELVRSSISIVSGLPCEKVRSAPAIVVSGPAQRLLTLWPARSRSRLATLSIESSDSFVAYAAVSIATGWSEPVPGRELHPLKSSAFHGALFHQLSFRFLQRLL